MVFTPWFRRGSSLFSAPVSLSWTHLKDPTPHAPALSAGSPACSRPMIFGTLGPKMSRSSRPTFAGRPNGEVCSIASAKLAVSHCVINVLESDPTASLIRQREFSSNSPATVDLPTPPFPLATTTICLTPLIFDFTGGAPLRGMVGAGL
jgi:hypothetical protein